MKWAKTIPSLFVVGIKDFNFSSELKSFLQNFPVVGLSLFNSPHDSSDFIWNDPEAALEKFHEFMAHAYTAVPFFAIDQEGGRVQRLKNPFFKIPSAGKIGTYFQEHQRSDLIFRIYQKAAAQLRLAGVQLNFGPVCDIRTAESHSIIGDRSFGTRPSEVVPLIKLFCEAMTSEGVACSLKHFPGHGPSRMDSHEKVALIEKDIPDYEREDRFVFEECAPLAAGIMTAHVAMADRPERILSLDEEYIRHARKAMPAHLLWMTDDLLTMKAVSERHPWLSCIDAEYDLINLCNTLDESAAAIEESIRYVEKKNLPFADEQKLEMRCRHNREFFEKNPFEMNFKKWKKQVLEISEQANELLAEENLI